MIGLWALGLLRPIEVNKRLELVLHARLLEFLIDILRMRTMSLTS